MAYALITDGGPNGRYTIQLDYGEARKAELIAAYGAALNDLDLKIAQTQVNLDAAEAAEGDTLAFIDGLVTAAIADGSAFNTAFTDLYTTLVKEYTAQRVANEPIRVAMRKLKDGRTSVLKKISAYNQCVTTETRQAWCADYTIDGAGYVGTIDIPGETDLILILPGAPYPDTVYDGVFSAREIMSPAQAYFNAAILPGWQKDKPTYRWGTLTAINWDANLGTVQLFDSVSSAQRLPINRDSVLVDVEFNYMRDDSRGFDSDSRVVVQLEGQSWDFPKIIGFLDNPRPNIPLFAVGSSVSRTFAYDTDVDYSIAQYFSVPAAPATYELLTGTLPSGLFLTTAGFIQGRVAGPTTFDGSWVSVRCKDRFYDSGKNVRYADSPLFQIQTSGYWATSAYFVDYAWGVPLPYPPQLFNDPEDVVGLLIASNQVPIGTTDPGAGAPAPLPYHVFVSWDDGTLGRAYPPSTINSTFRARLARYYVFSTGASGAECGYTLKSSSPVIWEAYAYFQIGRGKTQQFSGIDGYEPASIWRPESLTTVVDVPGGAGPNITVTVQWKHVGGVNYVISSITPQE